MDETWINIQIVHYWGVFTVYILRDIITTAKELSNYIIKKIITDSLKVITIKPLTKFWQCTWNMYNANLPKIEFSLYLPTITDSFAESQKYCHLHQCTCTEITIIQIIIIIQLKLVAHVICCCLYSWLLLYTSGILQIL